MAISPAQIKEMGQEELNDLSSLYKSEVLSWLNADIKQLLLDYLTIKNSYKQFGLRRLSDYSFLITPAFKALEGVLIQIGEELDFDLEKYNFKVGVVFSDDNLEKFYEDVLSKVESLEEEHKSDIQMWLNDARRILRHYRHSPAHYLGEKRLIGRKRSLLAIIF